MQTHEIFSQQNEFGKLYQVQINNMYQLIDDLAANYKPANIIYQRLLNEYSNYPLFKTTLLKIGYDCFYTLDNGTLQKIGSINRLNSNAPLYIELLNDVDQNNLDLTGNIQGENGYHDHRQYKVVKLSAYLFKYLIKVYFGE